MLLVILTELDLGIVGYLAPGAGCYSVICTDRTTTLGQLAAKGLGLAVSAAYCTVHVTDEKGLGQPACPRQWKKYEEGNE